MFVVSLVSIRDLSRNPSAVVDEVERSGRPALVTRNGKPIAALVRIDQDRLEGWLLSTVADPPIGMSLEESPDELRAAARPVGYGNRLLAGLTSAEADSFAEALGE
jgi:prevent-host-death family protein